MSTVTFVAELFVIVMSVAQKRIPAPWAATSEVYEPSVTRIGVVDTRSARLA
jgi:hypothetical protein